VRYVTTVLALLLASPLLGQEQTPVLEVGDKVRVTAPTVSEEPAVGIYQGFREDGELVLTAEGSGTEWAVAPSDVTKLEVYEGRKGRFWKGAGVGFVAAGTLATILCANDRSGPGDDWINLDPCTYYTTFGEAVAVGAFVGLFIGFPVGGVVGALIRYDQWEPIDPPQVQPLVAIHPTGRFNLGVSIPLRR
jgi:hypothetical protein